MLWLTLLASVAALGGLIAYAGDVVGRKIGRKHLRLFGLRPRTTGLIIAVLSGVAVALLSVGVVALLARDALNTALQAQVVRAERDQVRRDLKALSVVQKDLRKQSALLEGNLRDAKESLSLKNAELEDKQRELDQTTKLLGDLEVQFDQTQKERDSLIKEQVQLVEERDALAAKRNELDGQIARQRVELDRVRRLAEDNNARNAKLTAANVNLQLSRTRLDAELARLQESRDAVARQRDAITLEKAALDKRVAALSTQVGELNNSYARLLKQIAPAQQQLQALEQERDELVQERAALLKERNTLQRERADLKSDVSSLQYATGTGKTDIDALKRQNAELVARVTSLNKQLSAAQRARNQSELELARARAELELERKGGQSSSFVYRKGEVVHEVVIKADSAAAARAALVAAVRAAGDSAAEAGASRNSGNVLAASPDLDAVATSLAASLGPDLVILRSDRNLPRGLPLGLDFEVIPNRVIYRSGQPVRTLSLTVMSGGRYRQADDLRAEIGGLLLELVRDLRGRGVPAENIPPALVPDEEVEDFVDRLRSTDRLEPGTVPASVVPVGVVPRGDVTPAGPLRFYLVTLR